jgi:hypothetical protein
MIPNNITDQLVTALCNTLMHSLWQGLILAAIAGLTLQTGNLPAHITRRSPTRPLTADLDPTKWFNFDLLIVTYRFGKTINNQRHHNANGAQSEMTRVGN